MHYCQGKQDQPKDRKRYDHAEELFSAEPVVEELPAEEFFSVEPILPELSLDDIPGEEDIFSSFSIPDDLDLEAVDEMARRMAEEIQLEEQKAEEMLVEEAEPVFDIMQLLAAEAEKLANVSPIDMMDTYGELVIEITLEELVHYNNAQRSKRRKR